MDAADAAGRTALPVAVTRRDRPMIERLSVVERECRRRPIRRANAIDDSGDAGRSGNARGIARALATSGRDRCRRPHRGASCNRSRSIWFLRSSSAAFARGDAPMADGRDLLALAFDSGNARMMKAVLDRLPDDLGMDDRALAARSALRWNRTTPIWPASFFANIATRPRSKGARSRCSPKRSWTTTPRPSAVFSPLAPMPIPPCRSRAKRHSSRSCRRSSCAVT